MRQAQPGNVTSRRELMAGMLPAVAGVCLGCTGLACAAQAEQQAPVTVPAHKFLADSKMSFQEVFSGFYGEGIIPLLVALGEDLGRPKAVELLQAAAARAAAKGGAEMAKKAGRNDLAAFTAGQREPNWFWQHVITFAIVEDTPTVFEVKVAECLWAKTFREANAADFGYACICHGDFAGATGFNPKMKLIRTKTLMRGDDCCNHRLVLEA